MKNNSEPAPIGTSYSEIQKRTPKSHEIIPFATLLNPKDFILFGLSKHGRSKVMILSDFINANIWPWGFSRFQLYLKGQSHEKVGKLRVWRGSLGPN
jgi:hypothetical protein